ncbi:mediator of RNA polymerase II transcription subunit 15-like, partial [Osmerus mordax]|uniref:mediator of RNA polymerase II transcription subunit 15-like n=1 Tax=Osmerus mordax TaxID=8014 RepID=UPI0035109D2D
QNQGQTTNNTTKAPTQTPVPACPNLTNIQTQTQTQIQPQAQTQTNIQPQAQTQTQIHPQAQTQTQTQIQPQAQTQTQIQPQAQTQTQTTNQIQTENQPQNHSPNPAPIKISSMDTSILALKDGAPAPPPSCSLASATSSPVTGAELTRPHPSVVAKVITGTKAKDSAVVRKIDVEDLN